MKFRWSCVTWKKSFLLVSLTQWSMLWFTYHMRLMLEVSFNIDGCIHLKGMNENNPVISIQYVVDINIHYSINYITYIHFLNVLVFWVIWRKKLVTRHALKDPSVKHTLLMKLHCWCKIMQKTMLITEWHIHVEMMKVAAVHLQSLSQFLIIRLVFMGRKELYG